MEPFEERLRRAGLTGNEAKIYLELLKRGEINGSELAKKAGLDRSLTYTVLNNLIDKGLVSYVMKEKLRVYRAADPQNLLTNLEQREKDVKKLIPELKTIEKLAAIPQAVTVYEGKEGLKVLFEDIFKTKELVFFGGTGRSYEVLRWEMPHFEERIAKGGRRIRGIMNKRYSADKIKLLPSAEVRFLEGVDSDATTTIFGDTVGIHVLLEKPLVIIMKNKVIAEGYRNYFEFMWRSAKIAQKSK
ncbi:hypothetical protein HZB90_03275 [archaeon]|nr:hypothetical protein [archaeon]